MLRDQFSHNGLWETYRGRSHTSVAPSIEEKCRRLLDALEAATQPEDLNLPGMGYRNDQGRYSVDVNGSSRIAFDWDRDKPRNIDLE